MTAGPKATLLARAPDLVAYVVDEKMRRHLLDLVKGIGNIGEALVTFVCIDERYIYLTGYGRRLRGAFIYSRQCFS